MCHARVLVGTAPGGSLSWRGGPYSSGWSTARALASQRAVPACDHSGRIAVNTPARRLRICDNTISRALETSRKVNTPARRLRICDESDASVLGEVYRSTRQRGGFVSATLLVPVAVSAISGQHASAEASYLRRVMPYAACTARAVNTPARRLCVRDSIRSRFDQGSWWVNTPARRLRIRDPSLRSLRAKGSASTTPRRKPVVSRPTPIPTTDPPHRQPPCVRVELVDSTRMR